MTFTEIDHAILKAGKKMRALAYEGALKARKVKLVQELEHIESELAGLVEPAEKPAEVSEPVKPTKKPAAKEKAGPEDPA